MQFETERLRVRRFTPRDIPVLAEILADPAVMRFLEPPFDLAQTAAFVRSAGLCAPPRVYAVEEKAADALVGHLILHPFDDHSHELGWVLRRDCWGLGYASELTAAVISRAAELGVEVLTIECLPEQRASRRVAEKHGFRCVARGTLWVYRLEIHS